MHDPDQEPNVRMPLLSSICSPKSGLKTKPSWGSSPSWCWSNPLWNQADRHDPCCGASWTRPNVHGGVPVQAKKQTYWLESYFTSKFDGSRWHKRVKLTSVLDAFIASNLRWKLTTCRLALSCSSPFNRRPPFSWAFNILWRSRIISWRFFMRCSWCSLMWWVEVCKD